MRKDDFKALRGSPFLSGLTDTELDTLARVCQEKDLAEGMTLFIENMPGESLYLVREGAIRITRLLAEGDEETLVILGPEEIFGEAALIEDAPRAATARVVENARLIAIRRGDFDRLCEENPRLGVKLLRNLLRVLSSRVRDSANEYRDMLMLALGREK